MAECRSCHRPVLWARTNKGRSIPLDANEHGGPALFADGNIEDTGERAAGRYGQVMVVRYLPPDTEGEHYRTHFASCPQSAEWRRDHGTERKDTTTS